ncbi:RcnB family protein [Oceanicola sp. S124]|uniref:RcnB family protein n=1 Tax=Oceanicola sp. S124 TaxID=1042378 RepID=UPI00025590E7|nr:RcnB family protein [Oceanicola sp. S124]
MIHPTLTRVIAIVLAGTLTFGLAAPSFAQGAQRPAQQECQQGKPGQTCRHQGNVQQQGHQQGQATSQRPQQQGQQMHQLTRDQRHRLPEPPKGQSYRRHGDQVVRVDDSTGAVIAVVGLAAILLATR